MIIAAPLRESGNGLLDRLPSDEFEALRPEIRRVRLSMREVVHPSGVDVSHVYFPTTAMLTIQTVMEQDDPVRVGTVGREGMVGLSTWLGVVESPYRVICQMPGESLRVPAPAFLNALDRGPAMANLIRRYTAYMLRETSQTLACNARHRVETRCSRWLLMIHDQAGSDTFPMTHEFLAYILGVRRQTVTVVCGTFQNAGLIGVRRGVISIRDRSGLEESACECYAASRMSLARLMA